MGNGTNTKSAPPDQETPHIFRIHSTTPPQNARESLLSAGGDKPRPDSSGTPLRPPKTKASSPHFFSDLGFASVSSAMRRPRRVGAGRRLPRLVGAPWPSLGHSNVADKAGRQVRTTSDAAVARHAVPAAKEGRTPLRPPRPRRPRLTFSLLWASPRVHRRCPDSSGFLPPSVSWQGIDLSQRNVEDNSPKGNHRKAQGCEGRATLEFQRKSHQPQRGCIVRQHPLEDHP